MHSPLNTVDKTVFRFRDVSGREDRLLGFGLLPVLYNLTIPLSEHPQTTGKESILIFEGGAPGASHRTTSFGRR